MDDDTDDIDVSTKLLLLVVELLCCTIRSCNDTNFSVQYNDGLQSIYKKNVAVHAAAVVFNNTFPNDTIVFALMDDNTININTSRITKGFYFIRITDRNRMKTFKVKID